MGVLKNQYMGKIVLTKEGEDWTVYRFKKGLGEKDGWCF